MDAKAGGVLDGLTSLNALTRESSCAAIASLFEKVDGPEAGGESWAAAQRLIAGGLVKKLLPRMVDRVPGVKLQAIGAMRNISAVRDPRMCEVLVHDDCLTPVLTLLDRMSTAAAAVAGTAASAPPPGANTPKTGNGNTQQQQQQLQPALVMTAEEEAVVVAQLVATLCNLLAAVDVAVGRFTRQGGLQVVMRLLLAEGCRGSSEVFGGALQALHVATDSNEDLSRQLAAQPGAIDHISALVQGADVAHVKVSASMRVQAAGVLVNVAGLSSGAEAARSAEDQAELTRVVLPLLLKQMAYDPTALQQACVTLALEKQPATTGPAAGSAESSMDVDGEAGVGAAAAAGAASAAAPMQMETTTTGAAAGATKGGGQEPAQGTESENNGAAGNDLEGGEEKKEEGGVDQPDRDAQLRWEWKLTVAEPLKLTAEVMTNLCALASGDGEEEEEEEEWGSDDEDAMEQAACGGAGRQQQASEGALTAVLLEAMAEGGALQRTLTTLQALLAPTPRDRQREQPTAAIGGGGGGAAGEALPPPPAETAEGAAAAAAANTDDRLALPAGVAGDLADLRATVALCAANLVQNLPAKALGENPHALWAELCGMCEAATERAPSCVETVTGVMWGLVRRAGPVIAAGVRAAAAAAAPEAATQARGGGPKRSADPLPLILRLCDPAVTRAFEARVNAVGMLGALGSAAAGAAVAGEGAAAAAGGTDLGLGRALVQAMEDPHVLVQAEALNAVMDVYGDDGLDAAFRASGAPAALAAGVPAFRRKVKQEGKALGRDAMCHLKETALNAGRFVKYKQASEGVSAAGGKKREGR
ncbi:unnamed protein product [Ectocarpus sp. 6 AP-2014]